MVKLDEIRLEITILESVLGNTYRPRLFWFVEKRLVNFNVTRVD